MQTLTEKYRPSSLSEVIGQDRTVDILKGFVDDYKQGKATMPNLLFVGPPGLGKTTAARALCRDLYGEGWKAFVLELNSSDERKIEVVRGRIKDFAKTSAMGQEFNVIILDECDHLTPDAQAALRVTMEAYEHCRFVLCCNYPNKVLQPIIDRCAVFRFKPVEKDVLISRLREINDQEKLMADDSMFDSIYEQSGGSVRQALNLLMGVDEVARVDAGPIIDLVYKGKVKDAEAELVKLLRLQPTSSEVFLSMFNKMVEIGRPDKELYILGEYEFRVLMSSNIELQGRCLLRHLGFLGTKVVKK